MPSGPGQTASCHWYLRPVGQTKSHGHVGFGAAPTEACLVFGGGGSEGLDQVPSTQGLARPAVPLSTAHAGGWALPSSKACSGQGASGEMAVGMAVSMPALP